MSLKHELQSIISGNGSVRNGKIIQTITDYFRGKKEAIQGAAKAKLVKEQETQVLIEFIDSQGLWFKDVDQSKYIGEGDKCLIKYKKRYPKKYAEFDQILDDKARANFLKNDSKFRKIWREPGLPGKNFGKKELNAILHIKKNNNFKILLCGYNF